MPKYNKRIVKRICDLLSKDTYTIAEVCAIVKISESCFYNWQANVVEFGDAIARAREQFDELLVKEAKNSLRKKVTGYTVQEKHVVYVDSKDKDGNSKPKIKEQKVIDKHFQPDTAAIIFALTNKASDEYQNRQNTEVTGKGGKDLIPARVLTKEEAKKLLDELDNEC